jgi:hypothetical protein
MNKIDIVNRTEFQQALNRCVNESIEACEKIGASYDESYLENKWQNRLLMCPNAKKADANTLFTYAAENFTF